MIIGTPKLFLPVLSGIEDAMCRYTERISVTLPAETTERLRARAELRGISLGALMREILDLEDTTPTVPSPSSSSCRA